MAAEKQPKTRIRTWQIDGLTTLADTVPIDTSYLNLPLKTRLNTFSISNVWNGNTVSPIQSRLWFKNEKKVDDLFGLQYQPYTITPQDVRFYNTTTPYSRIGYDRGFVSGHEEHEINFLFTGNLNKAVNLGLEINYEKAYGHYLNQEGKYVNGAIWGSYDGPKYFLHASLSFNTLSNFENGGIKDVADLSSSLSSSDIPVYIQGMSGYKYIAGFLNHGYTINVQKSHHDSIESINGFGEKEMKDTIIYDYIPLISFSHTFETTNSVHRYIEQQAKQNYFEQVYYSPTATHDSSNVLTIRNTLAVTFEEEFNKLLHFGFSVYARNEVQRLIIPKTDTAAVYWLPFDNDRNVMLDKTNASRMFNTSLFQNQWMNNTFVGGTIYKKTGKYIFYDAGGEICLLGYKLGQFHVKGRINAVIPIGKNTMDIEADVRFGNEAVHYYLQHYRSNHFKWDNDFSRPMSLTIKGAIKYPTKWVKPAVNIGFENRTNHIYFDATDGLPHQKDGNIQIFSADVQCDLTTPWINLENHVVYQVSSAKEIPLPMLTLYHNLYYHGTWFKALDAQIGADMRFFTKYHAPILNPAIGQFCVQNEVNIGNYPVMSVYANFYVRLLHLKFFVQYTHLNHLFMRQNTNYLAMPSYPMNRDVLRAGLTWHFYN